MIADSAGLLEAHRGTHSGRGLGKLSGERAKPWRLRVGVRTHGGLAVLPSVTFFLNNRALSFGEH